MLRSTVAHRPPTTARPLRIASIPSSHVYVRHLAPIDPADRTATRLPDPVPPGVRPGQSPWWPPVMLDPGWVDRHADDFDIFHVHFGFDSRTPEELAAVCAALGANDRPLVFTMHDLRNPHHVDRRLHDEQLDVLVPAADALVTLTTGAADEIERRWGRRPLVVPHPHVVELDEATHIRRTRGGRGGGFRVGLHLKSLRAGMDAHTVLPGLVRAVRELPGAVLQVNGHRELLEPGGRHHDPRVVALLADLTDEIDLRVHDYFSDAELWAYLGGLDVSVLPYRHGTHSGWLEACRDLGTQVVAPTCGFYADQAPVHSFVLDEDTYDEQSLVDAVRRAHDHPAPPVRLDERLRQRDAIAAAHHELYARLVRA
jgi:beta-1,4-mannosyltransferase